MEHLRVPHIIVMGHTGCGGVKAAYTKESLGGMLDLWVTNIRNIMNDHKKKLSEQVTEEKKLAYLVKENVRKQVHNVWKNSYV